MDLTWNSDSRLAIASRAGRGGVHQGVCARELPVGHFFPHRIPQSWLVSFGFPWNIPRWDTIFDTTADEAKVPQEVLSCQCALCGQDQFGNPTSLNRSSGRLTG